MSPLPAAFKYSPGAAMQTVTTAARESRVVSAIVVILRWEGTLQLLPQVTSKDQ